MISPGICELSKIFVASGDSRMVETIGFHAGRYWPLEAALWDLLGKLAGLPVATLFGGSLDRLPAYASTGELKPPQERADVATEKPRRRTGLIADRKGRRVLVERAARTDSDEDKPPPRKPPSAYKGKRDRAPKDR